jgi:hypothetical protein
LYSLIKFKHNNSDYLYIIKSKFYHKIKCFNSSILLSIIKILFNTFTITESSIDPLKFLKPFKINRKMSPQLTKISIIILTENIDLLFEDKWLYVLVEYKYKNIESSFY